MISQLIFIADFSVEDARSLPPLENSCYSLVVNPSVSNGFNNAYQLIQDADHCSFSITVKIQEKIDYGELGSMAAFSFLPAYYRLNGKFVITLLGKSRKLLEDAAEELSVYLSQQGIRNACLHKLLEGSPDENEFSFFRSGDGWHDDYLALLRSRHGFDKPVYFYTGSVSELKTAIVNFQKIEESFKRESPRMFELIQHDRKLQHETDELKRRLDCLEGELNNQKKHNEILRSDHSTKELQLYYNREYEILPLWYKRFGHILKVLTGKRTFRSLFRDDVKKHKN